MSDALAYTSFYGIHRGMPCVVCGCGRSLNQVDEVRGAIVIGVNDVGRRTCPDYLVVVDDEHSMAGERWWFVAHSRATRLRYG